MSAVTQSAVRLLQDQEILGELLHSLSQPLTTLCCSLELSIEKAAGQQHEAVSAALEQAERVITQVRLLREYLDAELSVPTKRPVGLAAVLASVVKEMSSVSAVNQTKLRIVGTSTAMVAIAEPRLRLVLQYLLEMLVARQAANARITLRFEEGASESLLRGEIQAAGPMPRGRLADHETHDPVTASRKVKLAIASRVLESAGASLVLGDGTPAFVLRIPRCSPHTV